MKAVALALAVLVVPVAAEAATKHHRPHHLSQAVRGSYAAQPQIACTQVGCLAGAAGLLPEGRTRFLRCAERI